MEEELIREGAIKHLPNGTYSLFSQEAINGVGEIAQPGDYFKVDVIDGKHFPYPNSKAYFEANHRHIQGEVYEQLGKVFVIWRHGDDLCEEMDFLLRSKRLTLCPEEHSRYFNAILCGAPLSAPISAAVVFYQVDRDSRDRIPDAVFNFVACREFERDYVLLDTP